ncbi:Ubiquitin--protein ligase [Scedosporium apiospermum]|uniref:Ubiquitin--protein ligase n=1 Tax=Pseudallescheria apiosperma TaxID=563466 RepID=A0A084GHH5_PSEDA|nr:Ubiquitin--protein ligase [Scedosporium apiospermum]KEZ46787.1 Ubiquitin--protein ligase [Scedosporium apiospermum]
MSAKRIQKELGECMQSPPAGMSVALGADADIHRWHVTITGPSTSPYAGGTFGMLLDLPTDYPFKPPVAKFTTRIYHPNITNDSLGNICLAILKPDAWKPSTRLSAVLEAVRNLLAEPQPDDPLEARIADEYRKGRGMMGGIGMDLEMGVEMEMELNPPAPPYVPNPYGSGQNQFPPRATMQPGDHRPVIAPYSPICNPPSWNAQISGVGPLASGPVVDPRVQPLHHVGPGPPVPNPPTVSHDLPPCAFRPHAPAYGSGSGPVPYPQAWSHGGGGPSFPNLPTVSHGWPPTSNAHPLGVNPVRHGRPGPVPSMPSQAPNFTGPNPPISNPVMLSNIPLRPQPASIPPQVPPPLPTNNPQPMGYPYTIQPTPAGLAFDGARSRSDPSLQNLSNNFSAPQPFDERPDVPRSPNLPKLEMIPIRYLQQLGLLPEPWPANGDGDAAKELAKALILAHEHEVREAEIAAYLVRKKAETALSSMRIEPEKRTGATDIGMLPEPSYDAMDLDWGGDGTGGRESAGRKRKRTQEMDEICQESQEDGRKRRRGRG